MTIKVAVVDDHELFREGVITMLSRDAGIEVIGEGATAQDALQIAAENSPDVMLLDLTMPGGGIEATRLLAERHPNTKVLILTVSEAATDVVTLFKLGVAGYILKGIRKSELVNAVHSAHRGEAVISPALAARIMTTLATKPPTEPSTPDLDTLSSRESEVLRLVAQGQTNRQIAEKFGLSERAIKAYMTSIMKKLKVSNRVEATLRLRLNSDDTKSR